jgi:hypothetical protein
VNEHRENSTDINAFAPNKTQDVAAGAINLQLRKLDMTSEEVEVDVPRLSNLTLSAKIASARTATVAVEDLTMERFRITRLLAVTDGLEA